MNHLLVAESQRAGFDHIEMLSSLRHFRIQHGALNGSAITLPHGREDIIFVRCIDSDMSSLPITGRVFRVSNSFATDELYYYARHLFPYISDPITAHWEHFTKDAYINFSPQPEAEVIVKCMESINGKTKNHR